MTHKADVVVVGAGPAGIAAAVVAARTGRSTVLLEKERFVGGIPVKGHIATLCGLYMNVPGKDAPQMLYDGFPGEFAVHLMRLDRVAGPVKMGRAYVLTCRPDSFAAASRKLLEEEPALTVHCGSTFIRADVSAGRIQRIEADINGRRLEIEPGAVIDASGRAAVCSAAGTLLISPDESRQVPALIFPLHHGPPVDLSAVEAARWHMMIRRAVDRGMLPPEAAFIRFSPTLDRGVFLAKLNLGRRINTDGPISEKSIGQRGDEVKKTIVRFFKQNVAGFEKCSAPVETSPVLHRESARGMGEYVLTVQDVLSGEKFPDAVTKGCWPVERWDENGDFSAVYVTDGRYYEIPAGVLRSSGVDNLFLAGKCISADSGAIASARVIGCCLATGEAAAKLAANRIPPFPHLPAIADKGCV